MIRGYFWGYDGKFITREEYDKRVAEAKAKAEAERLYWLEHPDEWDEYNR